MSGDQGATRRPGGAELPVSIDHTPWSSPLDRVELFEEVSRGPIRAGEGGPPATRCDRVTAHDSGFLPTTSAVDLLSGEGGNFGRVELPNVQARVSGSPSVSGRVELPMMNQLVEVGAVSPSNQSVQARVSGSPTAAGRVKLPTD